MRLLALLVLALVPFAAEPARAGRARPAPAPGAWLEDGKAQALLRPWSKCPQLTELLAEGDGETVRARKVGRDVDLERYSAGSGRWATAGATILRLRRDSCKASGFTEQGGKESLLSWIWLRGIDGATTSLEAVAELATARVITDPDRAELAAARMLIELVRVPEPTATGVLLAPAWPVQATHPGRPKQSPATLWSPAALQAIGLSAEALSTEAEQPASAILAGAVRAPSVLATHGRWQLWELRFRARLGGGLLAVYDRERDQHRWLWASERDTALPRHFDVLAFCGDLAVVRSRLDDEEEVWAIDVARGITRRLARRGHFRVIPGDRLQIDPEAGLEDGERELLPLSALGPC